MNHIMKEMHSAIKVCTCSIGTFLAHHWLGMAEALDGDSKCLHLHLHLTSIFTFTFIFIFTFIFTFTVIPFQKKLAESKQKELSQHVKQLQREIEQLQVEIVSRNELYAQQCNKYTDRKIRTKNKFQRARSVTVQGQGRNVRKE